MWLEFGWTNVFTCIMMRMRMTMIIITRRRSRTSHSKRPMIIIHGMILISRNIMIILVIMRGSSGRRHGLSSSFSFLFPFISRGNDGSMILGRRSGRRRFAMMRGGRGRLSSLSSRLLLGNVDGTIMMLIKDWLIM